MIPTTTAAESLWLAALPATCYPPPVASRACDVLVLGAGITDLFSPHHVSPRGLPSPG